MTTLLKVILAVVAAWLGLAAPSTSADAVPISFVQTFGYDSHAQPMQLTYTTTERGPPVQHHLETTFDADGQQSFDALACSNVPTTSATYDYDDLARLVEIAHGSGRAEEQVGGTEQECVVVQGSVVAANAGTRLDWSIVSKAGETRAAHVALHEAENASKMAHGVFIGDSQALTNEAWLIAQARGVTPISEGGVDI